MKVEAVGAFYKKGTVNINNTVVVFEDNIAEVSDDLGQIMIDSFPYFFPEGKVIVEEQDPDPHVFDEAKYEEQVDRIIQLENSLKTKNLEIAELNEIMEMWKGKYEEMRERFSILSGQKDKSDDKSNKLEKVEMSLDTPEAYRNHLDTIGIEELKKVATEIQIDESKVLKKSRKKDWVDAIVDKVFET